MRKFAFDQYNSRAYDLACLSIPLDAAGVGLMSCEIAPGERSRPHNHFENEIFLFTSGHGKVRGRNTEIDVVAGEAVQSEAFENHIIENPSDRDPLRFISIYWALGGVPAETVGRAAPAVVFSTPPTPNGDLHLGHLSGPYLAADVLCRAIAAGGDRAWHVTGRDDHQTYVAVKAHKENTKELQVADWHAAEILTTLTACGIKLDGFIEPNREGAYAKFVRDGIARLYKMDHIYAKTDPAVFNQDGVYLHEAHVRGICPHCGEESDGNACEACGRPNNCDDLIDPRDRATGEAVIVRPIQRLYFRMSAFSRQLSEYIRMASMPARVFALSESMIADGLPDICISHPTDWGIGVPIEGFTDQIVYVWFEMAFGYLWAAAHLEDSSPADVWQAVRKAYGPDRTVVHLYGFDNSYYHTLLFPSVYYALDWGLSPARTHVVNELLDLEGSKFSTSRGHLIWGKDLLSQLPADYVRWGLCANRPEGVRSDFSLRTFLGDVDRFFRRELANWIAEFSRLARHGHEVVPEPGAWLPEQKHYYTRLRSAAAVLEASLSISDFSPRTAARELTSFTEVSARFARSQAFLFTPSSSSLFDYQRTAIALMVLGLRVFAKGGIAIIPDTAKAILGMLGPDSEQGNLAEFMPAGGKFAFELAPVFTPPAMKVGAAEAGA